MRLFLAFLGCLVYGISYTARADDLPWVSFPTPQGTTVKAVYGIPTGGGPHPAVVFHHGTGVRERGYEQAVADGHMNVADFVRALNRAGYAAIAPIREHERGAAGRERGEVYGRESAWRNVILGGVDVSRGALDYLRGRAEISPTQTALMGFSEGGLITLWSLIEGIQVQAGVLMSPATIRNAGPLKLKSATSDESLAHIQAPVLLTLGTADSRSIRKVAKKHLIPAFRKTDVTFQSIRYAGKSHDDFHRIIPEHWNDVTAFLDQHLKGR